MTDLTADDYDDMHHAIGRKGIKSAFRNNYCTETGSATAKRFEATGCWDLRTTINGGRDSIYSVNMKGLAALEKWLQSRAAVASSTASSSALSEDGK